MPTPPGFATCSYELKHASMSRSAFLTFGVDPTTVDPLSVATLVRTCFSSTGSLFTVIDSQVTLQQTRVSLGTDGGEDIVGTDPTTVACTKGLSSVPANCAVLVHKVTDRGGRRGRGRMYIPWAVNASAVTEGGTITGADATAVQNAVDAWKAALTAAAVPLVLLHRPSLPEVIPPSTPGSPNPVTSLRVDPLIATQRRRLGR